jgi:hypothetical protein
LRGLEALILCDAASTDMRGSHTIDVTPLSVRADISAINEDARTVDMVFSTGAAVERYDWSTGKRYLEKLSMDPKHVRLDRLNAAGPLLDTHSAWSVADVFGAVVEGSARMEKGKGLASVRFSKRDTVEPIWRDVLDRIIRSFSVGYKTYKVEEEAPKGNKLPVRTAIDWEPFEVSLVPMPADVGARVRSGDKSLTNPCVIVVARADADPDRLRRFRLASARV